MTKSLQRAFGRGLRFMKGGQPMGFVKGVRSEAAGLVQAVKYWPMRACT